MTERAKKLEIRKSNEIKILKIFFIVSILPNVTANIFNASTTPDNVRRAVHLVSRTVKRLRNSSLSMTFTISFLDIWNIFDHPHSHNRSTAIVWDVLIGDNQYS